MLHELPLEADVLHGHFSCDLEPVLKVDPGDSVRFSTPDAGWHVTFEERFTARDEAEYDGHALAGPIQVRGARAGQTLAVTVDEVRPANWGTTFAGRQIVRWELDGTVGRALGRTVELAPFLGVLGMPPAEPGRHSTGPPRRSGGNIDCKELVAGTTLFLPITAHSSPRVTATRVRATARSPARRSRPRSRHRSRSIFATICRSSGPRPGSKVPG